MPDRTPFLPFPGDLFAWCYTMTAKIPQAVEACVKSFWAVQDIIACSGFPRPSGMGFNVSARVRRWSVIAQIWPMIRLKAAAGTGTIRAYPINGPEWKIAGKSIAHLNDAEVFSEKCAVWASGFKWNQEARGLCRRVVQAIVFVCKTLGKRVAGQIDTQFLRKGIFNLN